MDILQKIRSGFVFFDGGLGTALQKAGLHPGELPEAWNLTDPEKVIAVHKSFLDAGSNIICANTFGANPFKIKNLRETVFAAIDCARRAVSLKKAENPNGDYYVALDVGSLGKLLKPLGELDFETAVSAFAQTVRYGTEAGADLIAIETMNDLYELKAAVLAAKENSSLPVFASVVFDEFGKLMTGADPSAVVAMLEGLGVDALGTNCSLGPKQLKKIVPSLAECSSVPLMVCPNAGLPKIVDGETVFEVGAEEFAEDMADIAGLGAQILGGCCGTTPEHIRALVGRVKNLKPLPVTNKSITVVSSYSSAVRIGGAPVLVGERINPTGKPKFKQALRDGNINYILDEGFNQKEKGVHILDVNVGLPEIDEAAMMVEAVTRLQSLLSLPLQLDTSNTDALEKAMRIYNGKPLVNSVNGKQESMAAVFPLIKKYGGAVVALTLDEGGIPDTAEGRFAIAEKIVREAEKYGIDKKNIIVDALTMAVSADPSSALVTLSALELVKARLGVKTCLGVSNVSFGLPNRGAVNSVFFTLALKSGLDAAIMNPYSAEMLTAYYGYLALSGQDSGFEKYIPFARSLTTAPVSLSPAAPAETAPAEVKSPLRAAIENGLKDKAGELADELIKTMKPIEIIDTIVIPALDCVGMDFEKNKVFLPQLLASAEAAREAFERIRKALPSAQSAKKGTVVIATVKGDIHDIGKNIVGVILENYGYRVIDLGRDVPEQSVVDAVKESGARLVGLSALMTTTVVSMESTIKLLRKECPEVTVMVGGAVLTQEYADMIGADIYAKDAMASVRFAEGFFN